MTLLGPSSYRNGKILAVMSLCDFGVNCNFFVCLHWLATSGIFHLFFPGEKGLLYFNLCVSKFKWTYCRVGTGFIHSRFEFQVGHPNWSKMTQKYFKNIFTLSKIIKAVIKVQIFHFQSPTFILDTFDQWTKLYLGLKAQPEIQSLNGL